MKGITALLCVITLSTTAWSVDANAVITAAIVMTLENGRKAVVDVQIPDGVSLSADATLLAQVETDKRDGPPDEFGPPQNFALRGTSHGINTQHFRVTVALPQEKSTVRFLLRDGRRTLLDTKKDI